MVSQEPQLPRKLAAILEADVVGYSRLMGDDEAGTLSRLRAHRRELVEPLVKRYHGHIIKLMGDGILAEFPSVVDAVACAVAIQRGMAERNEKSPEGQRIEFRMGVNLGDVLVEGGDIYGDGVNIAARLESLAEPGGICISGTVYDALGNKLPLEFDSLGEKQVKNISTPIRVYSVRLAPGAKLPDPHGSTRRASGKVFVAAATIAVVALAASLAWFRLAPDSQAPGSNDDSVAESSSKPVVAVLPLDNLSGDPEQQYFSDGVSDDIITDLSRLSGISVIARNTSFSFRNSGLSLEEIANNMAATHVLSGSIRRQGDNVRVNVALIDTSGGVQLWADRFDRSLDDIFAVQSEISGSVAKALSIELTGDEKAYFQTKATDDFVAYDLFLKGQQLYLSGIRTGMLETKAAYQKAIERDPGFARAYSALGVAIMREVVRGWSAWPAEAKDRALSLAEKAVSLDPHSQHVYWALGFIHLYRGEHDAALEAAKRAVELAPSYGDGYGLLALVSNWMGESENAIRYAEQGIALNPNFTWDYPYNIGRAKYQLGAHEEAERYLLDALKRNPAALPAQVYLIANYASAGNLEDAEWQVMQLGVTNPEVTVSHVAEYYPFGSQTLRDAMLGDLKAAGLPE